jgi:hypothetical protein
MSHNTDAMVQELRAEFESMLSYVKYGRSTTADQVERGCSAGCSIWVLI